jgi:hypothetical protein
MAYDLYTWSSLFESPPIAWPDGKRVVVVVAIVISCEFFSLTPSDTLFRAPGHMKAAFPDCRHFTARDYDSRLGVPRLLAALAVTGTRPTGWLPVARSQSWNTPRLLGEARVGYCMHWVDDELPFRLGPLVNLPLNHQLSDRQVIATRQQSVDSDAEQLRDAYRWLDGEVDRVQGGGGRMLPIHLTPHISAQPYRIDVIAALFGWLAAQPGCWSARADEIVASSGV